jgi:outer membrane biosynthesis protein TonB
MPGVNERKNRKISLIVTASLHVLLFLILFFIPAWREPDPPIPEYGIELNFGLDTQGSGEALRPEPTPVVEEQTIEQTPPEAVEEVAETEPSEVVEELSPSETVTQPEPSPDVVEEIPEAPVETAEEVEEETTEEVQQPEREVAGQAQSANQGDNESEAGDKGKEEGTVDARAIYGAQGSSKGASLQMEGWNWDYIPRPDDTSDESGRIVFQITIDDQGEVIGVRTLERTVSPSVERLYREAVVQVTFSRTADNLRPTPTATGKITFVIKAR